jgi:uncharacterized membrane protein
MCDLRVLAVIGVLGLVNYILRSGGFLAAGIIRQEGPIARFLRLAPGNLFIAFVTAACLDGGWPSVVGCIAAVAGMVITRKEWVALTAGFSAADVAAKFHPGS